MKITQIITFVTLVSLPLYVVRCKDLAWCSSPVPFTLLEILILASFASWAIWRLYQVKRGITNAHRLFERLRGPFFWPLAIFLLVGTVAMFVSPDLKAAAGVWKAYFIEPALLFIVVLDISLVKRSVYWVLYPLILSGVWLSVYAISQSVTGVDPFAPSSISFGRVTGVYDNPNALGLYLGPLLAVGLGLLIEVFKEKNIFQKKFLILFLIISLALFLGTIYFSKSRGGSIAATLTLLFFVSTVIYVRVPEFFRRFGRWFFYLLIASFLTIFVIGFVNIGRFAPGMQIINRDSIKSRLCIWQGTKNIVKDSPILGIGLSGFPKVYPDFVTCEPYPFQYPHNIFLNFWVEVGLAGLLLFIYIVYKYWRILYRYLDNFIAIGLFSVVIYIFTHGMVDVPYFKNDLSSQFWVLMALAIWFEKVGMGKAKKI
jgi:O-antigen ligase